MRRRGEKKKRKTRESDHLAVEVLVVHTIRCRRSKVFPVSGLNQPKEKFACAPSA
jgi:hypothetical protein